MAPPSDFTVLCRARTDAHPVVAALRAAGADVTLAAGCDRVDELSDHRFVVDLEPRSPSSMRAALESDAVLCSPPNPHLLGWLEHGVNALVHDPAVARGARLLAEHARWLHGDDETHGAMTAAATALVRCSLGHGRPPEQDLWHLPTPAMSGSEVPRPRAGRPLPDFLGIGAQKAGTTWLAKQLTSAPGVHIPAMKELHFFDLRRHLGIDWFHDQLEGPPGTRVRGEITPAYAVLPDDDVRQIARAMPDCRIIFSVRDPVERAWSAARMEVGRLAEREGVPLSAVHRSTFVSFLLSAEVDMKSRYLETIRRWRRHFGRDNVHVMVFEDIAVRPQAVVDDVCRFLDLPRFEAPTGAEVVFRGVPLDLPATVADTLRRLYAAQTEALEEELGRELSGWSAIRSDAPSIHAAAGAH